MRASTRFPMDHFSPTRYLMHLLPAFTKRYKIMLVRSQTFPLVLYFVTDKSTAFCSSLKAFIPLIIHMEGIASTSFLSVINQGHLFDVFLRMHGQHGRRSLLWCFVICIVRAYPSPNFVLSSRDRGVLQQIRHLSNRYTDICPRYSFRH